MVKVYDLKWYISSGKNSLKSKGNASAILKWTNTHEIHQISNPSVIQGYLISIP